MVTVTLVSAVLVFSLVVTLYFAVSNMAQMVIAVFATTFQQDHQRRNTPRARGLAARLPRPPVISVVVPAYNEELTIVESLRALLALGYERREIVVVNDGSSDGTMARMKEAFHLLPAPVAFAQPLPTAPVRGLYRSADEPALVVIDKANGGGKADASNAGINAASGALVLIIDADTVLEPDALSRAVIPFLEDQSTIGVGANLGLTNGCRIQNGRITGVALPRSWFARFQIIEYMRSFLLLRLACAHINAVPIISGAFGLFSRDAVLAVGGFDRKSIGEDMDLTTRLQKHFRDRKLPFRITFDPNILCWTQAPEDWASLRGQRCRWRRGLMQVLWQRRHMIGNPRYGVTGLVMFPYVFLMEGLGPLVEVTGYVISTIAALLGILDWRHYGLLVAVSLLFGWASTLLAVFLSDVATRRYMTGRDLFLLVVIALVENLGYRQLVSWWGFVGTVQAMTGKSGWGVMKRRAFESGPAGIG